MTAFEKACCPNVASAKYFIGENVSIDSIFTVSLLRIGRTNSLFGKFRKVFTLCTKRTKKSYVSKVTFKKRRSKKDSN